MHSQYSDTSTRAATIFIILLPIASRESPKRRAYATPRCLLRTHDVPTCSGGARRRRRRRPPTASRLKGPRKQKSFAYKLLKRGLAKSFAYKLLKRGLANLMPPTSTSGVAPPLPTCMATPSLREFGVVREGGQVRLSALIHYANETTLAATLMDWPATMKRASRPGPAGSALKWTNNSASRRADAPNCFDDLMNGPPLSSAAKAIRDS
ncbi:hypothetical protein EVAR_100886_1 [Eumeta japonica]|uniref:Uncharacterized protein n=1 Tax=Eumeta variegata TaxID=151549 RepID=A0A4C2ACL4_EUMVA|nr:hypothetical protein EVAR_100886_1 [Eumeta japonica]